MSIVHVRDAFVEAGQGQFVVTAARLRYANDGKNSQILEFDGRNNDGSEFSIVSDPFAGTVNPQEKAREMAAQLLAKR